MRAREGAYGALGLGSDVWLSVLLLAELLLLLFLFDWMFDIYRIVRTTAAGRSQRLDVSLPFLGLFMPLVLWFSSNGTAGGNSLDVSVLHLAGDWRLETGGG